MKKFFRCLTNSQMKYFIIHVKGLLSILRGKNMEAMGIPFGNQTTKVIRASRQTNSMRDDSGARKMFVDMVMNVIGNSEGAFIYDDTDILKVGKKSVGVASQYNGRLGHKALTKGTPGSSLLWRRWIWL
ncbi:MAG: transposase, partial [Rickettsiales bacterium]|nr:transposase [Rickettsiales bacterium]